MQGQGCCHRSIGRSSVLLARNDWRLATKEAALREPLSSTLIAWRLRPS